MLIRNKEEKKMDNSQRKTQLLDSNLINLLFSFSHFPTSYLVPHRKMSVEIKKEKCRTAEQLVNCSSNKKLINFYNMLSNVWIDSLFKANIKLGNYSPTLATNWANAFASIACFKLAKLSKINDMYNSDEITHGMDSIYNSISPKIKNTKIENILESNFLKKDVENSEREQVTQINEDSSNEITIMSTQCDNLHRMKITTKKPFTLKTWRELNIFNRWQDKGPDQFKSRKTKVKQSRLNNYNCKNDINIWEEVSEDSIDMVIEDCDIIKSNSLTSIPLLQTDEPECIENLLTMNFDSPIQSPKNLDHNSSKFRMRYSSESSVNSEGSSFVVFETDIESQSTVSDGESSNSEESESEDDYNQSDAKVRFHPRPQIHLMIKWNYAYRAARKGPWEQEARDRERFRCRIDKIARILNPILLLEHRENIYQDRCNKKN